MTLFNRRSSDRPARSAAWVMADRRGVGKWNWRGKSPPLQERGEFDLPPNQHRIGIERCRHVPPLGPRPRPRHREMQVRGRRIGIPGRADRANLLPGRAPSALRPGPARNRRGARNSRPACRRASARRSSFRRPCEWNSFSIRPGAAASTGVPRGARISIASWTRSPFWRAWVNVSASWLARTPATGIASRSGARSIREASTSKGESGGTRR